MASSLIDNMSADFAPDKFSDEYQDQLRQLIAAKLEQGDALDTAATFGEKGEDQADRGEVVDLMEALRRSVEQNRAARKTTETKPPAQEGVRQEGPGRRQPPRRPEGAKKPRPRRERRRRQRLRSQPKRPVDLVYSGGTGRRNTWVSESALS